MIYDEDLQKQLFKKKIDFLWDTISKEQNLVDEYKIEYLIKKAFFLGTFF